jgi:opacity protein-like surface antigen
MAMKKLFFCLSLLFAVYFAKAQRLLVTGFAGMSNYQGDLQDKRFTFDQAHLAGGLGVAYELTDQLFITAGFKVGKISGDDKKANKNATRNLSFSSPLTELQLGLEYDLISLKEQDLTPYLFAGVAGFHFNPSTLDSLGRRAYLQPLGTEGQGFYNGRKKYNLSGVSLPFGAGLRMALNQQVRVGFEIGLRKTFTDYLDDVSTTYADKAQLLLNNGPRAVELAFRSGELKPAFTYPAAGAVRGNPASKDWYYFAGFTISFRINGGDGSSLHGGKSKTGCPVNVY